MEETEGTTPQLNVEGKEPAKKQFLCPICAKAYSTKGNLKCHYQTIHLKFLPFKCIYPGCDKSYYTKSKLKLHLRTHIDIKPYLCQICYKTFKEKSHLKIHMLFHSDERPFKCPNCEKSYKTKGHLKEHIRCFHEKNISYTCNLCLRTFYNKANFDEHLVVHSNFIESMQRSGVLLPAFDLCS